MKKILVIFSCAAILVSCSSDTEKSTSTDSTVIDQNAVTQPGADTLAVNTTTPAGPDGVTPATPGATTPAGQPAAPGAKPAPNNTVLINISTIAEEMRYDQTMITVKAGQKVILTLTNNDSQQHNLIIVKIGAFDKVGKAATAMSMEDPNAMEKGYVPNMPEVITATPLLNADESSTIQFTVPSQPGDYPYMCTFPGHYTMMKGILRVVK